MDPGGNAKGKMRWGGCSGHGCYKMWPTEIKANSEWPAVLKFPPPHPQSSLLSPNHNSLKMLSLEHKKTWTSWANTGDGGRPVGHLLSRPVMQMQSCHLRAS